MNEWTWCWKVFLQENPFPFVYFPSINRAKLTYYTSLCLYYVKPEWGAGPGKQRQALPGGLLPTPPMRGSWAGPLHWHIVGLCQEGRREHILNFLHSCIICKVILKASWFLLANIRIPKRDYKNVCIVLL